jgi:hypothetical protein
VGREKKNSAATYKPGGERCTLFPGGSSAGGGHNIGKEGVGVEVVEVVERNASASAFASRLLKILLITVAQKTARPKQRRVPATMEVPTRALVSPMTPSRE